MHFPDRLTPPLPHTRPPASSLPPPGSDQPQDGSPLSRRIRSMLQQRIQQAEDSRLASLQLQQAWHPLHQAAAQLPAPAGPQAVPSLVEAAANMERWQPFLDPDLQPPPELAQLDSVPAHRVTMQISPRGGPQRSQAAELLVSMHNARASAPSQLGAELRGQASIVAPGLINPPQQAPQVPVRSFSQQQLSPSRQLAYASPFPRPGSSLGHTLLAGSPPAMERSQTASARLQLPSLAHMAPVHAPTARQGPQGRSMVPGIIEAIPQIPSTPTSASALVAPLHSSAMATTPPRVPARAQAPQEGHMSPQLHAQLLHLASRRAAAPHLSPPGRPAQQAAPLAVSSPARSSQPNKHAPLSGPGQGRGTAAAAQSTAQVPVGSADALAARLPPSLQLPLSPTSTPRRQLGSPMKPPGHRVISGMPVQPVRPAQHAATPGAGTPLQHLPCICCACRIQLALP